MAGIYSVTVLGANSCTGTATTSVVVYPKPSITIASNSPVCEGTTISLSASGGTTYSWAGPAAFASTQQNPSQASATTSMAGVYSVSVTNSNSCSNSATTSVVVNPKPSITIASNSPVCEGNTISLSASGGTTYSWAGPSGFSTTQQNPTITEATTSQSGIYSVTVASQEKCTTSVTVSVKVNPLPKVTASSNSPVCFGNTLNLSASGGVTYSWSGPAFSSSIQNPSRNNATVNMSGTYSVTVTDANGCIATASTTVTINTATATASANSPVCVGASIELSATGGGSYSWAGPSGFTSTEQNPTRLSAIIAHAGTYSVSVTSTNQCSASATTLVQINAQGASASSNSPICGGATIELNASAGGSGYSWAGPSGFVSTQQEPTRNNATSAMAGVYSVTIIGTNNCTGTATTSVVVNTTPTATASSDSPVCEGKTLTLSASGGSSYSWAGPNGFVNTQQNPQVNSTSTVHAGVYSVTVISSENCKASATVSVTINTKPTITVSSNSPVCTGQSLNLSASGGVSYSWSGPSFSSTQQTPQVANITSANQGIYSVTVINATACSNTATISVQVNELPKAVANSNSPVCENATIILTSDGGIAYSWAGPGAFTSTGKNVSIPLVTSSMIGVYTVTVTGANTCTNTATTSVTVVSVSVQVTANSQVCTGGTISLSASGATTYTWTGPNGFSATGASPTIPNATLVMAGIYSVSGTGSASCKASATISVAVNSQGATASTNSPLCEGGTLNLSASAGGSSYSWAGPSNFSSTLQNPSRTNASSALAGVYSVTVLGSNSCTGTATTSVSVNPNPTIAVSSNSPVCEGGAINLSASGGNAYSWAGPLAFASTQQNPSKANASSSMAGVYSVSVTNSNSCSNSATTSVAVSKTTVSVSANSPVCLGGTISLSASGGNTYSWSGPDGFSASSATPSITNASSAKAGVYSVSVTGAASCTASATTSVVINSQGASASTNSPLCEGGTLNLSASAGGSSYSWAGPSNFSSTLQNPSRTNASSALTGVYSVTILGQNACTGTATVSVAVRPTPTVNISSTAPCPGGSILLSASGGGTYSWSGPNGFTETVQNPTRSAATSTMSGIYSVTVISTASCTASATTSVQVKREPEFTLTSVSVTCNGSVANSDGKIIIKGFNPTDRYQFLGIYSGSVSTTKTYDESTPIPSDGIIASNLPNPSKPTTYGVLVLTKEGCSKFDIVVLEPTDCQCPPAKCVPFTITKTKSASSDK
ncbi:MAG: hypothetical protein U0Y10_26735 [Spirosomataceae bacterium]